jgi:drug/metabolite transporter (DMT)-like permease
MIGIATIILGVLILITKGSLQSLLHIRFTTGDLLMLIASFFASYTILVRLKPKELPPKVFLFSIFVLGVLFSFRFIFGTPLLSRYFDSTTFLLPHMLGLRL